MVCLPTDIWAIFGMDELYHSLGMVSMGLSWFIMVISHGSPYLELDRGVGSRIWSFFAPRWRLHCTVVQSASRHTDLGPESALASLASLSGEAPQVAGDSATNRDCSPSIMGQWGGHISEGGGFFPRTSWWGLGLRVFCWFEDVSRSFGLLDYSTPKKNWTSNFLLL